MATKEIMPTPLCLIEHSTNGQLVVNQKALEILSGISQPVVVVTIVGPYRTGKSYLMNKLAGQKKGFSLGSTVRSHTKGIWMWCVPHSTKKDLTLVLLDTEGLGDVEKGNPKNDTWIFVLAVLLSSTLVYNSMGTINQQAMDQLHYVSELTEHIRTRARPNLDGVDGSAEFVSFFPDFVWTVRDFTLELKLDGHPITEDQYLENALQRKRETEEKTEVLHLPQSCIVKYFPTKKCFVFPQPTTRKNLPKLEELQENELEPEFVEQAEHFSSYIFQNAKAKTIQGGVVINGTRLKILVENYVQVISSGNVPCMENVVLALAEIENSAAVQKAIACYEKLMRQLKLPTNNLQELLNCDADSTMEAIEVFRQFSFKDEGQRFQKELGKELLERKEEFYEKNEKMSADHCWALIQDIFQPLEEETKKGTFSKSGGYKLFVEMKQKLKKKYNEESNKGLQAEEMLLKYLQSKEDIEETIFQTDMSLLEKEKEIAVERAKAEAVEQADKQLQELQELNRQMLEQMEKSHQEHVKQLTQKMKEERQQMMAEQEETLNLKFKDQEKLIQKEFQNERKQLEDQIQSLQEQVDSSRKSCVIL